MSRKKSEYPEKLRKTYSNMKERCYNPNAKGYKYYGGKGINICDEWLSDKIKFFNWSLDNGYNEGLSIDRIETDKDYEPNNCRWITMAEQQSNRTNNVFIEFNGKTKTISQWSRETGVDINLISSRYHKGENDLFREPEESLIKVKINGEYKSLYELSDISGIPYSAIYQRYNSGWAVENLTSELLTKKQKLIEINGVIHTLAEWAEISGITKSDIFNRILLGWDNEDLIKPKGEKNASKKYINIDGIIHSKSEWCKLANISPKTFNKREKKGLHGKDLIAPTVYSLKKKTI